MTMVAAEPVMTQLRGELLTALSAAERRTLHALLRELAEGP